MIYYNASSRIARRGRRTRRRALLGFLPPVSVRRRRKPHIVTRIHWVLHVHVRTRTHARCRILCPWLCAIRRWRRRRLHHVICVRRVHHRLPRRHIHSWLLRLLTIPFRRPHHRMRIHHIRIPGIGIVHWIGLRPIFLLTCVICTSCIIPRIVVSWFLPTTRILRTWWHPISKVGRWVHHHWRMRHVTSWGTNTAAIARRF